MGPLARYIIRQTVFYAGLWFFAMFVNFLLPRVMPGEPLLRFIERLLVWGGIYGGGTGAAGVFVEGAQEILEHYKRLFALDKPPHEQFIPWLINFFMGKWGVSLSFFPEDSFTVVMRHIPNTLMLLIPSLVISWIVGNYIGAYIAFKGRKLDKLVLPALQFLARTPTYWLIIVLIFIFGVRLGVLPITGRPLHMIPSLTWDFIKEQLKHWILPMVTLTTVSIGGWSIGMRAYVIYQLNSNYVRYCKAIGVKDRIISRYIYRNALNPQLVSFAIAFGGIFAGNLLVEMVYGYPGMGSVMARAIGQQDIFLMQAVFSLSATMLVLANFIADVILGILDPRIRRGITEVVE